MFSSYEHLTPGTQWSDDDVFAFVDGIFETLAEVESAIPRVMEQVSSTIQDFQGAADHAAGAADEQIQRLNAEAERHRQTRAELERIIPQHKQQAQREFLHRSELADSTEQLATTHARVRADFSALRDRTRAVASRDRALLVWRKQCAQLRQRNALYAAVFSSLGVTPVTLAASAEAVRRSDALNLPTTSAALCHRLGVSAETDLADLEDQTAPSASFSVAPGDLRSEAVKTLPVLSCARVFSPSGPVQMISCSLADPVDLWTLADPQTPPITGGKLQ
jgi:hypothetical protein